MSFLPNIGRLSAESLSGLSEDERAQKYIKAINDLSGISTSALNKGLTIGQNLDAQIHEFSVTVPSDWQSVTFGTDWQQWSDANFSNVGYRKTPDGRRVQLRGLIDSTGAGAALNMFNVASGYEAASNEVLSTVANNAVAGVNVFSSGAINYRFGDRTQWFSLFGLSYEAADPTPVVASCWPYIFKCTVKSRVAGVKVFRAVNTDDSSKSVFYGDPSWEMASTDSAKKVKINNIPGLAPGYKYKITLIVWPE